MINDTCQRYCSPTQQTTINLWQISIPLDLRQPPRVVWYRIEGMEAQQQDQLDLKFQCMICQLISQLDFSNFQTRSM